MGDNAPPAGADAVADAVSGLSIAPKKLSLASQSVHADDHISAHRAIAPALHVSTNFEYNRDPEKLSSWKNTDPAAPLDSHIYSRESGPNTTRLEAILSSILNGPSLTYASGLAAFYALMVRLNPRRIVIGQAYHGCHGIVQMMTRLTGLEVLPLPESFGDPSPVWEQLQPGDVVHVETPINPTGEAVDLAFYAARARERGAFLTVDATFAPPPLQDPFVQGADVILHSGTKYFGGHSDMLCGVLAVAPRHAQGEGDANIFASLRSERLFLGSVMGSLEGWLGIRSLRTLELRVRRQSETAVRLAAWLYAERHTKGSTVAAVIDRIAHASLMYSAKDADGWLLKQMPGGFGPVFAIWMKDWEMARRLPSKLSLFHHATSLGGVESLIEWRRVSDPKCNERLLRVSVGVEGWEDLRDDLLQGFEALLADQAKA